MDVTDLQVDVGELLIEIVVNFFPELIDCFLKGLNPLIVLKLNKLDRERLESLFELIHLLDHKVVNIGFYPIHVLVKRFSRPLKLLCQALNLVRHHSVEPL